MVCVCSLPALRPGILTHPKENGRIPLVGRAKGPQCHLDEKLQTAVPCAKSGLPEGFSPHPQGQGFSS